MPKMVTLKDRNILPVTVNAVVNGDLGNADTSYTYVNMALEGFTRFFAQFTIEATTLTLEATLDDETVAPASATWVDVTSYMFGVSSVTATGMWLTKDPVGFTRIRFKRLTTNATNAFNLKLVRMSF